MQDYFIFNQPDMMSHYSSSPVPRPENFKMHTHEWCEVYYFSEGKGTFKIEGSSYPLESGDILLMRPLESHYIDIDPSHRYTRFSAHFDPAILKGLDPDGYLMRPFYDREAGKKNLYRASSFKSEIYKSYLKNAVRETENRRLQILSNILPLLNEISAAFSAGVNETASETLDYKIVNYINNRLSENITLDEICREFYISKPHLCRVFKEITGSTVWDYITVKRLLNAKMLIGSGIKPTKACGECGFNDYSTFYRAYVKKFGTPPSKSG
ncbi:MAG TPA: hypothetical protein DCP17_07975 [Ruminococcaceae bacterium]|nr:hypothetical protein [Oscillospiraceae bacterium]HCD81041.1 hypothetical protein [Oscillospiraceae bacterium]